MAIVRATPDSQPAVTFDRIHMTRLEILQPLFTVDAQSPVYSVVIQYREYGVDLAGVRHYKTGDPLSVGLNDFLTVAATKAAAGQPALLNALQAIQTAVATIITDQTGVATTVV